MKNTTTINFRNKFDKLIRNDAERQLFVSAFEKFLGFNHEDALRLLWELTCGPSEWTLYKLGLSTENVSPSMENALRNELRSQYKKSDSTFLDIAVPDDCKEAFSELKKYSDVIVSVVVYQRIVSTLKMICENEINRISYLLSSTTENHYFGGLRALGFNSSEANYLKENHLHIHTLFVAMVNSLEKAYNVSSEQSPAYSDTYESIAQLPLAEEAELPFTMSTPGKETAETVVPQETEKVVNADVATTSEEAKDISSEDESYNEDGFIVLTAKSILQNLDPFRVFVSEKCDLASLKKLLFAGLNLNEVVQKAEEIARIVKAFDNFEQSFNELDKVMDTLSFPLDVDD